MMIPIGVVGGLLVGATLIAVAPIADDLVIEQWVFGIVYLSFLLWGVGMALLTWQYWNGTRPACADHAKAGHAAVTR
jgi:hypothetical protein